MDHFNMVVLKHDICAIVFVVIIGSVPVVIMITLNAADSIILCVSAVMIAFGIYLEWRKKSAGPRPPPGRWQSGRRGRTWRGEGRRLTRGNIA